MITVSDEQIAQRDMWERLLIDGKANLFDALCGMLASGAPATPYLMQRLAAAEMAYKDGAVSDFAEAFGFALSASEKRQQNKKTLRNDVKFQVTRQVEKGFKLLNPNQHPGVQSAFTEAAKYLDKKTADGEDIQPLMSVSTIFDIYYDRDAAGKKEKT